MSQLTQATPQTQQQATSSSLIKSNLLQRAAITPVHGSVLQRCSNGVECPECCQKQLEREGTLQRAAVDSAPSNGVPPIVHDVLRSPGQSLDAGTRAFMEPRFGYDFSGVRVHTDARAAESAKSVNALAYTVGRDVVFGAGQYAPGTSEGRRLMAHELTHTIQQGSEIHRRPATLEMTHPEDATEREAQAATNVVMQGEPFASLSTSSLKIAREGTASQKSAQPPTVFKHNTELGGLIVGNFDFHFRECGILVWVWLKFKFTKDINAIEQADFKKRFLNAVHSTWAHTGYSLTGKGNCPCGRIPIEIHAEENTKSFYHKLVDVEKKTDQQRRPKVISDINVNLYSDDLTLAHEFGHVLGLYDEYDGGFFENIMFWHENPPGEDPGALMATGTELRPRYFEHYRRAVQKTAPKGCEYTISSPVPPGP